MILSFANPRGGWGSSLGLRCDASSLGWESRRTLELRERVVRLYEEYRGPLFRYLLWLGLAPEDSEEIIQEAFLRLYEHLHGGGHDDNLKGWLYRVCHNLALNQQRDRRHLARITPEELEEIASADLAPSPEELLLHNEKLLRLHRAIATLSPLQRSCVHLRIGGFRYREIAEILGVAIQTVSESLRRAIEKLTRGES